MLLFIVSGASGVGKTSACEFLLLREKKYIVMESSRHFNEWLKQHAGETVPAMELLDNTCLSVEQTVERIDAWMMERIF